METTPVAVVSKAVRAVTLVVAMLLAACGGAQSRLANHMQRGQALFAEGNFAKADIEFRNAIQISPKDPVARVMEARTAEKLGRTREAYGLYQSVVDDTPGNVEARVGLGRLMIFGGLADKGLAVIQSALDKHPDDATLLTLRAVARLRLKNQAGALVDVDRALVLAPDNEEAVALRAGLYREAGDVAHAKELVANAVRARPDSAEMHDLLARIEVATGETDKAEEQLRTLIRLKPEVPTYRNELAGLYLDEHRVDDAQRLLEEAVKQVPGNGTKFMLVGFVTAHRSLADGERVLRGFVASEPDNYDLRLALGDLLLRTDSKEAIAAYDEVVRRDDTGPEGLLARDRLAAVAVAQTRYDDANTLVEQVLKKNSRDADALALRGEMRLLQGKAADAIEDLRATVRDQPKNVKVQRMLAAAYAANGNPGLAQQSLRSAIDLIPGDVTLRIELARMLTQDHKADQAVTLMEETVRSAPQDAQAREELVRAYIAKPDLVAARKAADELAVLRPDSPAGPFLAGLAVEGQMQLGDARKYFERALALQPKAFDVLEALARLDMAQGQGAQAIARVKEAVDRDPKNPFPLNLLGGLYLSQKNVPMAIEVLTSTTTLAPNWPVGYRNLALAKFAAKDVSGAIAAYESAIKVAPDQPELAIELASQYESLGRIEDAVSTYEAWHKRKPQVDVVSNNLAKLLVTYKTDRASLDQARELTRAFETSNDGGLLDTDGWVHYKRGEYADALTVLQRAAERAPRAPEVRYHLGMAELSAGQSERAREDLQTALAGSAKFSWSGDARRVLAGLTSTRG